MTDPALILIAEPGVAAAVLHLSLRAYQQEARLLGVEDFPPLRESATELLANRNLFFACAPEDDASRDRPGFTGVMELAIVQGGMHIERLVVAPECFRMGIGSRLIRKACEVCTARLTVTTAVNNQPAVSLYSGMGFHETSRNLTPEGIELVHLTLDEGDR